MTRFLLLTLLLWTLPAGAGVDQGNPRRVIYGLVDSFQVDLENGWTGFQQTGGGVRVEGPLTYRADGYFTVQSGEVDVPNGMHVCDSYRVGNGDAKAYWIGKDCGHLYFVRQFEMLKRSVSAVGFPNVD